MKPGLYFIVISILFFTLLPLSSSALESFPEFQSLTEQEQSEWNQPSLLGPEYQANLLAFTKPASWEYAWLSKEIAFDTSLGSISAVHFLLDTRLKVRSFLNPWLQFRFTYFDERNHDRQSHHGIFELVAWPWKKLGISVYGEPAYAKRQNDIGLALIWQPVPTHEIRLFHTWVDVTRQKRSDRTDTFINDDLPYAMGLVGRYWLSKTKDFLEYAVRYETPTRWRFPDEGSEYRYSKRLASVYFSKKMSDFWRFNLRVQGDRKFEARDNIAGPTSIGTDAWTNDRVFTTIQAELHDFPFKNWELWPGFQYAHRRWSTPRDTLTYHDYLPNLFLKTPSNWTFHYSFTRHGKTGGTAIGHPTDTDAAVNHRLDVGYIFAFSETAELRLQAGFDLDAFGTGDTWQAGSALFRWSL